MTRLFCSGYVQAISPFHVCQKALYHSAIRDFKYNVNLRGDLSFWAELSE